jgi:FtsP/CotA-like multicopper oxidase with cupredoxin domain
MLILAIAMMALPMVAAAATLPNSPVIPYLDAATQALYPPGIGWNPYVNYSLPNFAQSPNIRKFVDTLPGVGAAHKNNLGQYIPLAHADTATFPGDGTAANPASDFYEISIGQYNQQMHSDLPVSGTTLRGYSQISTNGSIVDPNVIGVQQYLGPLIIAHSYDPTKPAGVGGNGKPVRLRVYNNLPLTNGGALPIPVDTTIMGAGMGPSSTTEFYTQNRATIHLHGGATPWISDGTPHQWFTPVGATSLAGTATLYPKGVSFQNVPDMITGASCHAATAFGCITPSVAPANDGIATFYYTNEQSARLMFYHDHAYGITRLNVYDGMAAPFLLVDPYEEDMITGLNTTGVVGATKILPDQAALGAEYKYGIPLVIQDKFFVNDANTGAAKAGSPAEAAWNTVNAAAVPPGKYGKTAATLTTDPLWAYFTPPFNGAYNALTKTVTGGEPGGNLWLPSTYLPIENPNDPTGNTPNGRWDYSPFMIPPALPLNLTLPEPTLIPETFADTMVVNGTAFPYVSLPADALRFRILNACNDRTLNLQLYYAYDPVAKAVCKFGNAFTPANCTEVSMVPASPDALHPSWPVDGRDGGVPDPANAGPPWIQIGNEGGFMAQVAVTPQQPIDYEYNRQNIPLAGVTSHSLLLLPAMRADVVVDLHTFSNNDVLMVYNDAPAPMPNFWPINDYYTDDVDQTSVGAAPTTPPGFGPNTRTVMQIRVTTTNGTGFDFSSAATPGFVRSSPISGFLRPLHDDPLGVGDGPALAALKLALPKVFAASQPKPIVPQTFYNYAYPATPAANDNFVMGYQTTLNLNTSVAGVPLAKIKTVAPGNNYTVTVGAVINPAPPTVTIVGGFPSTCCFAVGPGCPAITCTKAVAQAGLNPIGTISLLTAGTGYTSPPKVTLGAPAAAAAGVVRVQATAVATISGGVVNAIDLDEPGANYTNTVTAPTCTITGGGGTGATCSVTLPTLNTVGSIILTGAGNTPGNGYTREPEVFLVPAAGSPGLGATAVAELTGALAMTGKNLTEGFDVDYGRMDIRLGSTPNPLTPSVGAGFVVGIARYIDPPTEIMQNGQPIIWRLSHLGVDSHAMHFHLFNLQVVNRVDFTNVIKPPYPEEIGWKETIRTNPMEDLIVAIQPYAQVLPFVVPHSSRVLDPTTPLNSTTNFYPVAPPPGVPAVAQQSNVQTDFGWEYVWHCHLLGHEENDMMRPMVLVVPVPPVPTWGAAVVNGTGTSVTLNWATTDIPDTASYTIQRATNSTFTTGLLTLPVVSPGSTLTLVDPNATLANTRYYYRIQATGPGGTSAWSTTLIVATAVPPTNFNAVLTHPAGSTTDRAVLTWTAAPAGFTNYTVQRARNAAFTTGLATFTVARTATTLTVTALPRTAGAIYWFRIRTNITGGSSAWSTIGPYPAP